MKDVQNEPDSRGIQLQKVGVKNVKFPIVVKDKKNNFQNTIGTFNMYVSLDADKRGTHMSRFLEILNSLTHQWISSTMLDEKIKERLKKELQAKHAHLEVEFTYFVSQPAPQTMIVGRLPVECRIAVSDYHKPIISVTLPVITVCPCSLEITKGKAHNQRAYVTVELQSKQFIWFEDIIEMIEASGSCYVAPILKREDEKWLVEEAFKDPKFVEDVARDLKSRIEDDLIGNVTWFRISVESEESIHPHNAYAEIEGGKYE